MVVYFVDTTVLCNLLPVPGRDQHRVEVIAELSEKLASGSTLILPVAAVVEVGNHIAGLANGHARRRTAELFKTLLEMVCENEAPWTLHQFTWGEGFIRSFVSGAMTGMDLVEHTVNGIGGGDLSILAERATYRARTGIHEVHLWTRDGGLAAHN